MSMDFNTLAETILLTDVKKNGVGDSQQAKAAVQLADDFFRALKGRELRNSQQSGGLTKDEVELVLGNQVIKAIKSVRERTGLTLKDAKAFLDAERRKLGL